MPKHIKTIDKPMVWNQCIIAPVLGYDSLVSKNCFIQEEPVGSRNQVGDRAFCASVWIKYKRMKFGMNPEIRWCNVLPIPGIILLFCRIH